MVQLGRFRRTETGYAGALKTLTLDIDLRIEPAPQVSEKAPDHRVFAGDVECGAAWTPEGDAAATLNIRIDDPGLPSPIRARLVRARDDEEFVLVWRRTPGD